jgi:hypothetical protein
MSNRITYANKVALNQNSSVPDINKVNAIDMNEIKEVVNGIIDKSIDMFSDTPGLNWKDMMKNKIDYCVANMDSSKENTSAFINGGWQYTNFGFGICSKIGSTYQLTWYSDIGIYYCRKIGSTYSYDIINGNNYGFYEQVIGKWVNDKPLYRQSFSFTGPTPGQETVIAYNLNTSGNSVSNIDEVVNYKAFYKRSDGSFQQVPNYHYDPNNWSNSIYDLSGTGFAFWVGNLNNSMTIDYLIVTIEYTKTTD